MGRPGDAGNSTFPDGKVVQNIKKKRKNWEGKEKVRKRMQKSERLLDLASADRLSWLHHCPSGFTGGGGALNFFLMGMCHTGFQK